MQMTYRSRLYAKISSIFSFRRTGASTRRRSSCWDRANRSSRRFPLRRSSRNTENSCSSVSLRKGARATTAIEGNTLSEEEVARIDAGEKLPPSKEYLQDRGQECHRCPQPDPHRGHRGRQGLCPVSPELIERFNYFVGKDLGEHFQGIPGKFRAAGHNVVVGTYRPPLGDDVAP